jgi:hypothetical protein
VKEWLFKFFIWKIQIKISRLEDKQRISFLVRKLIDELIAQGHDITLSNGDISLWIKQYNSIPGLKGKFSLDVIGEKDLNLYVDDWRG